MEITELRNPSRAYAPQFARANRARANIERSYVEGLREIVQRYNPEDAQRLAAEANLTTSLSLEVLLDIRELIAECAWRLSELAHEEPEADEADLE